MSVDIVGLVNNATTVVIVAILLLGIYRAVEMRRVFVSPVYRSRAAWSAFLMLIILISFLSSYIPIPSTGPLSIITALPFIPILLTFFAYADRSVLVAMNTDFFHRNTLGWFRVRLPASLVLVAGLVAIIILFLITPAQPLWVVVVTNSLFLTVGAVLAYATAALIVGARRSADRTLRKSILFLGLALSTLVLDLVLLTPLTPGTLPFVIVSQGTALVGIYLIYRSVMSLSPGPCREGCRCDRQARRERRHPTKSSLSCPVFAERFQDALIEPHIGLS
jgi:hypothetical protein